MIVEREFHTATVHQGYIEPQTATALWNNDGRVHLVQYAGRVLGRDQSPPCSTFRSPA